MTRLPGTFGSACEEITSTLLSDVPDEDISAHSGADGSDPASAADNGLGHAFVLKVRGKAHIYHLNRADGHIDSNQLVVHKLGHDSDEPLFGLPELGYVSPLGSGGYPALEATATRTSGLTDPDAILGAARTGNVMSVLYVSKNLSPGDANFPAGEVCPKTPSFALTNLVNKKPRKTNHDVITSHDIGRYQLHRCGCRDRAPGFDHGRAERHPLARQRQYHTHRRRPLWSVLRRRELSRQRFGRVPLHGLCGNRQSGAPAERSLEVARGRGFDNPILSTDTVVDPATNTKYPANAPLVNVTGADALTAAQVAPYTPPAEGVTTNFFSGRVYDPQAVYTDERTVTIVFAGYNTPQPSNNLGDYRSIGRFQLRFPSGYLVPSHFEGED